MGVFHVELSFDTSYSSASLFRSTPRQLIQQVFAPDGRGQEAAGKEMPINLNEVSPDARRLTPVQFVAVAVIVVRS
jgi:hypothetical protein